jgi:large subunit ribosomal protein L31
VSRETEKTVDIDGRSYPVVDVDISSHSHPFWTGNARTLDTEGRVQAFERRYGRKP